MEFKYGDSEGRSRQRKGTGGIYNGNEAKACHDELGGIVSKTADRRLREELHGKHTRDEHERAGNKKQIASKAGNQTAINRPSPGQGMLLRKAAFRLCTAFAGTARQLVDHLHVLRYEREEGEERPARWRRRLR